MALTLSAAERALIASKIDFSKTTGRYSEAYREIVRISDARPIGQFALSSEERYWYTKAAEINSNDQNSSANLAVRGITAAGLLWSGTQASVQSNSDAIARNVFDDVLGQEVREGRPIPTFEAGNTPPLSQILSRDVNAAITAGNQTLGGWGGAFYYWNYAAPGDPAGRTIGQVISSDPVEFEKFLTINAAALVAVARQEFGGPFSELELRGVLSGGLWAQAPAHVKAEVVSRALKGGVNGNFGGNPDLITLPDGTVWSKASEGVWLRLDNGPAGLTEASQETKMVLEEVRAVRLQNSEKGNLGDVRFLLSKELPRCFPGFTQISLPDGSAKRMDSINIGDHVLSFDPHADGGRGKLVSGVVTKLFSNVTSEWLKLEFDALPDGSTRRPLVATPGHETLKPEGGFARLDQMVVWTSKNTGSVTIVNADATTSTASVTRIVYAAHTADMFEQAVVMTGGGTAGNLEIRLAA
jgi:hypothetical protein